MADPSQAELVRVLVGPDQREFVVHRKLLCASSPFFHDSIEAVPEGLAPVGPPQPLVIWLSSESAGMFELFVLWLYRRQSFHAIIDEALTILASEGAPDEADSELWQRPAPPPSSSPSTPSSPLSPSSPSYAFSPTSPTAPDSDSDSDSAAAARCCSDLHWNLVHLHLFAALIDLPALQDVVMDTLQDMYLRLDWEATPGLIRFLYAETDPFAAFRLRKWAVALLAWTLSNQEANDKDRCASDAYGAAGAAAEAVAYRRLFVQNPPLRADYRAHRSKMAASLADVRIKNPQLRIPSNRLRREDRHFGFRQCSFHSHRRSVGEGRCPHSSRAHKVKKVEEQQPQQGQPQQQHHHHRHHHHHHHHCKAPPVSPISPVCTGSEPRLEDLPVWSPLSATSPGLAPLGMESTI